MYSLSKPVCRFRLFQATRLRGCYIDKKSTKTAADAAAATAITTTTTTTTTTTFSWTRKIAGKISEDVDGDMGNTKMTN
jgi:hypothetical protein